MLENEQAKIALEQPDGRVETLWADIVGPNLYRLDNLPWYAYGVSLHDIVEAHPDTNGQLRMVRVVEKSGHRTIRVICELMETGQELTFESKQLLAGFVKRGCSYEGANKVFVAVNIPSAVSLEAIVEYVEASDFKWEYADPSYEELFPDAARESAAPDA